MLKYRRRWIDPQEQLRRWLDPRLPSVRVANVRAYLAHRGWREVTADRPQTLVFQEPGPIREDGPFYQFVPATEQFDNYPQQIFELVSALAVIEDRPAVAVLQDILGAGGGAQPNGVGPGSTTAAEKSGVKP